MHIIYVSLIAPVLNNINEISILQGTTDFAYNEYVTAEDLQEVTYDFKTDSIDINTVGEYTMSVVVTDKSGNEVTKDIKVIVLEKPTGEVDVEIVTDPETGKVTTKKADVEIVANPETEEDTPTPSTPHVHTRVNEVSEWFSISVEADAYGEDYLINQSVWVYNRYGVTHCPCGMYGVIFMQ